MLNIRINLKNCRLSIYDATSNNFLWNLTDDDFDGAYQTISQVVDYFNLINFPNVNILKTKDSIQSMPLCIYYRKHSCLLKPFNEQINSYQSSGLIVSWASAFRKPLYLKDKGHIEPTPLSMSQISGLVTVCIICFVISIIVFILELMSTSHGAIKILLDFLTLKAQRKRITHPNIHLNLINLNKR